MKPPLTASILLENKYTPFGVTHTHIESATNTFIAAATAQKCTSRAS